MSSPIIKARTLKPSAPTFLKREVHTAHEQAETVLAEARQKAAELVKSAKEEAETRREAARQEGYAAGLGEWNKCLTAAVTARDEFIEKNEAAVVQLAIQIARKIIGDELRLAPDQVVSIAREALRSAPRAGNVTLQVHPDDEPALRRQVSRLQKSLGEGRKIELVSNADVARGGCLIASDIGIVDAQLETQLEVMSRALLRNAGEP
jgi:type III secretion protein L